MAIVAVARPFRFNHGRVHHAYAIGVYDIPDAILAHGYVQHHLETAVLARGEALIQQRTPQLMWAAGDRYGVSLSRVSTIEALPPQIWKWPPQLDQVWDFGPHVEPAPGAVIALREMEPVPGSDTNEWRHKIHVMAAPATLPYHGGAGTYVHRPPLSWPFASPQVGDLVMFGVPAGVPLGQLDNPPPPRVDPQIAMMMDMQTRVIAQAQTSLPGTNWLHEHNVRVACVTWSYPVQQTPDAMLAATRKARSARATVHPDYAAAAEALTDDED
jgi:hypothetical protein